MNDFGRLASGIITYGFCEDESRFPISYISGWLETNLGELNGVTNEEFYIDDSGNIGPSGLEPVEEHIFSSLYEIHYYNKTAREVLRGVVYADSGSVLLLKEGDTTIQFQNKNSISKTLRDYGNDAQIRLQSLIGKYNVMKSSPLQVAGEDGLRPLTALD